MNSFLNGLLCCNTVVTKVDAAGKPSAVGRKVNGGAVAATALKTAIIGGLVIGVMPNFSKKD